MQTDQHRSWRPAFIAAGYLSLLASAYFDSIRGPLIPILVESLKLPFNEISRFLAIGNLTAVVLLAVLNRLLKNFGDKRVGLAICFIASVCALVAPSVKSYNVLMVLGILMGGSIAGVGALCNIFTLKGTPLEWRSRILVGNHVMYGIGSFCAPLFLAVLTTHHVGWPYALAGGALLFLITGLFILFKIPSNKHEQEADLEQDSHKSFQILVMALFGAGVAGEVTAGAWMVTYLTQEVGVPIAEASNLLSGFYLVMTLTRIACFSFIKINSETKFLWASVLLPLLAYAIGRSGAIWAFPLIGFVGPFFPVLLARVSRTLPKTWPSLTVKVIFTIQLSLAVIHALIGQLVSSIGAGLAYFASPIAFVIVIGLLALYLKAEQKLLEG